ncbi:ATP-binding protein, partial [Klebsiella variicola]|uniref:ATP-binding protein n=1 Tax=Klebsiella variicola TaxID=244366 RepID=UPI002731FF9D
DGAKSLQKTGERPFDGFEIKIELSKDKFSIIDNCGGFDSASAAQYAFRFGRPQNFPRASHSIGQFGVGMKRALFKFGTEFKVRS